MATETGLRDIKPPRIISYRSCRKELQYGLSLTSIARAREITLEPRELPRRRMVR